MSWSNLLPPFSGKRRQYCKSCDIQHWIIQKVLLTITFHYSTNLQHPALILRIWPIIINSISASVKDRKEEKVAVCDCICKFHFSLSEKFTPYRYRGMRNILKRDAWSVWSSRTVTVASEGLSLVIFSCLSGNGTILPLQELISGRFFNRFGKLRGSPFWVLQWTIEVWFHISC